MLLLYAKNDDTGCRETGYNGHERFGDLFRNIPNIKKNTLTQT
jgi:DNA-binding HxlR family transcriptional regulator